MAKNLWSTKPHPASCPLPDHLTQAGSHLQVRKHWETGSPFLASTFSGNARVSPFYDTLPSYRAMCIKSGLKQLATVTEVLFPGGSRSTVHMHCSSAAHKEILWFQAALGFRCLWRSPEFHIQLSSYYCIKPN